MIRKGEKLKNKKHQILICLLMEEMILSNLQKTMILEAEKKQPKELDRKY